MGYKTGESRSLMEQKEKETKMVLPDPTQLGTLGPILQARKYTSKCELLLIVFACLPQLREATVGFQQMAIIDNDQTLPPPPPHTNVTATSSKFSKPAAGRGENKLNGNINNDSVKIVLEKVTFDVESNSKIALVGKNGVGKSTLMKLIADIGSRVDSELAPCLRSGDIYKHHNIRVAYYQQHQQDCLPYELSPLEHLTNIAPEGNNEQTLRAHLGSFGLCGDLALEKIGILSGGQKARVVLSELTLFKPHLLLLDEPTNNIDLEGIKAMKDAISKYNGACIIASHDMSFLDETVETVYHVNKKAVTRLENGVEEYKEIVRNNVSKQKKKI